jgi:hypothetical protein
MALKGFASRVGQYVPTGRLWPSGEFSVGSRFVPGDEEIDGRPVSFTRAGDEGTAAAAPLDLRDVPNPHKSTECLLSAGSEGLKRPANREKYGRKGITGYGKKMLRSLGALIDRQYPSHRVTFSTITMPELPQSGRRELALVWPELTRQLLQWLSRHLERAGVPKVVGCVSEIQPRRLCSTGEGYLHLHLLWLNVPAKSGRWSVDVGALRAWVSKFLSKRGLLPSSSHVNTDVRSVKGSKASYLAKYSSKGSQEIEAFATDNGWDCVPSQWWNMTGAARSWVKGNTLSGDDVGELLTDLVQHLFDTADFSSVLYLHHVDLDLEGRLVTVGWFGAVDEATYKDLLLVLDKVAAN